MFPNYNIKGKAENEKYKQRITNNLLNALKYRNMVYKKYLESIRNSQSHSVVEPVYVTPNFYWNTI